MSGDRNEKNDGLEAGEAAEVQRRAWIRPVINRMQAGDAEMPGDNPEKPEGFAMGS